jgi:ATP/maltotriose-dependent transcriptional regulator MalT
MRRLSELGGKRIPFLRWSVLRMIFGARHLVTTWQVGDGREEALAAYVAARARANDLDDVIRVIDEFCYEQSIMMNVERGGIQESGFHLSLLQGLSELHLGRGDLAAAALAAEQLCALAARPGERTYLAMGHRTLALVAQAAGDSPRAQVEVSRALAVLEGAEAPLALWRVQAMAAQL